MIPNSFPVLKKGDVIKFQFNSLKGSLEFNCRNTKVKNVQSLKGKTIYPFLMLFTLNNKVTLTIK